MSRSTALVTWDFPCRTFFNQFSFQKYFLTQYQKPILIWFVLPSGQRTVPGEIFIEDSLHQILSSFHHTQLCGPYDAKIFSDAFDGPSSLSFFLEWSLSLIFRKYSMKSQTLLAYCDKQEVSHLPWNEFRILRFDSSKNSHSHWVQHNFNRKHEYNLWCRLVLDKIWLQ